MFSCNTTASLGTSVFPGTATATGAAALPATHRKLYVTAPKVVEWVEESLPTCPPDGVLVRTATTCMSVGTELRCYRGIPVDDEGKYLHEW